MRKLLFIISIFVSLYADSQVVNRFRDSTVYLSPRANVEVQNQFKVVKGANTTLIADTNGNVGIGTATPAYKLQVTDNIFLTEYLSSDNPLIETGQANGAVVIGDGGGYGNFTTIALYDQARSISITDSVTAFQGKISVNGDVLLSNDLGDTATAKLHVKGDVRIEGTDSVTIYAFTPAAGTFQYCTDCTGNGIVGRLLGYIGGLWRRFSIE
jgi:hypothetical protein